MVPVSSQILDKIRLYSKEDIEIQELRRYTLSGWPNSRNQTTACVKSYWNNRADIHLENDLIFFQDRVIVPSKLREEMLTKLHEGHLGISKTHSIAAQTIYWPRIYQDICDMIITCKTCAKYQPNKKKEPMERRVIPTRPWSHLAMDIMNFNNVDFLIVVDVYSKWLEILKLSSKQAKEINHQLLQLFSRHGIPDLIYCDNNPFNSKECCDFAKELSFQLVFSSPNYPQSNGQAERFVKVAKNIVQKCYEDKTSVEIALLNYRNSKVQSLNATPAQLLNSRRLKTKIPVNEKLLQPELQTETFEKLKKNQDTTAANYNKSYLVKADGKEYVRTSRHIRKFGKEKETVREENTAYPYTVFDLEEAISKPPSTASEEISNTNETENSDSSSDEENKDDEETNDDEENSDDEENKSLSQNGDTRSDDGNDTNMENSDTNMEDDEFFTDEENEQYQTPTSSDEENDHERITLRRSLRIPKPKKCLCDREAWKTTLTTKL
ncbi:hypothetical protein KUF71_006144 [Frankliniella fusca]|uniref:RNA-directed DNA polymerase n=1 Tax=Frankliniella fusca TaxID=407009 RepID=A0AAE1H8N7_9NEOP|nr:hypothetical protein KUF71_006144 [Frankliniella fusca]